VLIEEGKELEGKTLLGRYKIAQSFVNSYESGSPFTWKAIAIYGCNRINSIRNKRPTFKRLLSFPAASHSPFKSWRSRSVSFMPGSTNLGPN